MASAERNIAETDGTLGGIESRTIPGQLSCTRSRGHELSRVFYGSLRCISAINVSSKEPLLGKETQECETLFSNPSYLASNDIDECPVSTSVTVAVICTLRPFHVARKPPRPRGFVTYAPICLLLKPASMVVGSLIIKPLSRSRVFKAAWALKDCTVAAQTAFEDPFRLAVAALACVLATARNIEAAKTFETIFMQQAPLETAIA
jgi:hypothetical protein